MKFASVNSWLLFGAIRQFPVIIRLACLALMLGPFAPVNAQQAVVDSLENLLSGAKPARQIELKNLLALHLLRLNPDKSNLYAREALALAGETNNLTGMVNAKRALGHLTSNEGDYVKALLYYHEAASGAVEAGDYQLASNLYRNAGWASERMGGFEQSIIHNRKALHFAQLANDKNAIGRSHSNLAEAFRQIGGYANAIRHNDSSLHYYALAANSRGTSEVLTNIGNVHFFLASFDTAIHYYERSLKLKLDLGNFGSAAGTINNIAAILYQTRDFERAASYYRQSIALARQHGLSAASTFGNFGLLFLEINLPDSARHYFSHALDQHRQQNSLPGIASTLINQALVDLQEGLHDAAESKLKDALTINRQIGDKADEALTLKHLGGLHLARGNLSRALVFSRQGHELAKQLGLSKLVMEIHGQLADIYYKSGGYKDGFLHLQKATQINDSLLGEEKRLEISRIMEQHEIQKREQRISGLAAENQIKELRLQRNRATIHALMVVFVLLAGIAFLLFNRFRLKRKQEQLTARFKILNIEQRLLRTQLNPHALSNALQMIASDLDKNEAAETRNQLMAFAKLFRLLLENSRKSYVSLQEEIDLLEAYLSMEKLNLGQKFSFKLIMPEQLDAELVELPNMLLQPFVENAIKHGIRHLVGEGRLLISIEVENGFLICTITDNGIGREASAKLKKQQIIKHQSLGTKLIEERLALLEKIENLKIQIETLDLQDGTGKATGTKVIVRVPLLE